MCSGTNNYQIYELAHFRAHSNYYSSFLLSAPGVVTLAGYQLRMTFTVASVCKE